MNPSSFGFLSLLEQTMPIKIPVPSEPGPRQSYLNLYISRQCILYRIFLLKFRCKRLTLLPAKKKTNLLFTIRACSRLYISSQWKFHNFISSSVRSTSFYNLRGKVMMKLTLATKGPRRID